MLEAIFERRANIAWSDMEAILLFYGGGDFGRPPVARAQNQSSVLFVYWQRFYCTP